MEKDKIELSLNDLRAFYYEYDERKIKVLDTALGGLVTDGSHHKQWYLDQVIRILTECPVVEKTISDRNGVPCKYLVLGESEEYLELVKNSKEEGLEWDVGCPP